MAAPLSFETFFKRTSFRTMARQHLAAAKTCLATGDEAQLFYAALELRKCFEALIYETAKPYANDFSQADFSTWQPGKLLAMLLEIDPIADRSGELRFARENEGEPPVWRSMGKENRLTLKEIKENYDALGSFLHVPTINQLWKGKLQKVDKLKARCETLIARLDEVLSASVWNFDMKQSATLECAGCGNPITRRLGRLKSENTSGDLDTIIANCFHCQASYRITPTDDGKILWEEELEDVPCPHDECDHVMGIWKRDIRQGIRIRCSSCQGVSIFALGISPLPLETE